MCCVQWLRLETLKDHVQMMPTAPWDHCVRVENVIAAMVTLPNMIELPVVSLIIEAQGEQKSHLII